MDQAVYLSPLIKKEKKEEILKAISQCSLKDHLWVATSGSTEEKFIALSAHAMEESAKAVNARYNLSQKTIWLRALPLFHIAGLAILQRAHLSGGKVHPLDKWSASSFLKITEEKKVTAASVVPTQIYDLVSLGQRCPKSLELLLVGGDALHKPLEEKARELGYPIFRSYGMTEAASSVASTIECGSGQLVLYPHIEAKVVSGCLAISSSALFTLALIHEGGKWSVKKREGEFFLTKDRVEILGDSLTLLGRSGRFVKILGEGVDLDNIQERFDIRCPSDVFIFAEDDEREGKKLVALCETDRGVKEVELYNREALFFRRIKEIKRGKIERSALFKPLLKSYS